MTNSIQTAIAGLTLSLAAGVGCVGMNKHGAMTSAPPAVRDAAMTAAGGHKIEKIKQEDEDGATVYEATFEVDQVEHTLTLNESGDVIEEETEVEVADLPPAVSAAVLKAQPLARVKEAAMVKKGERSYYEVDAKVGGAKHELAIDSGGTLMSDKVEQDEHHGEKADGKDKD